MIEITKHTNKKTAEKLTEYQNILNQYIVIGVDDKPFVSQAGIAIILADYKILIEDLKSK